MSGAARRAVRLFVPLRPPRLASAPTRAIGHGWPIEACPRRDARTSRPTKARWRGGNRRATGAPFLLVTFLWASKEKSLAPSRRKPEKKSELSGRETRHKTGLPGNNRTPTKYPTPSAGNDVENFVTDLPAPGGTPRPVLLTARIQRRERCSCARPDRFRGNCRRRVFRF